MLIIRLNPQALVLQIQQEWNSRITFHPTGVARLAWREQEGFSPLRQLTSFSWW